MPSQDAAAMAQQWLSAFDDALANEDFAHAASLFHEGGFWRDLASLTWNIYTAEGRREIESMLGANAPRMRPANWRMTKADIESNGDVLALLAFDSAVGAARGRLVLRDGRAWVLFTALVELNGFEEQTAANGNREQGVRHGAQRHRKSWLKRKQDTEAALGYSEQPYCVIVGGGQGGLGLAARLKRLNVPTIVVEKNEKAGDSWRNRYQTLCLHDPVQYDHLPYIPFPEHWPVFSPKDKLGDWLEMYAKVMELNFWGSTLCLGAQFDETSGRWDVRVERDGVPITLRPAQLVLATGMSGFPNVPDVPGADSFAGEIMHSSDYRSGERYANKACVVIGSNTSGHDIAADLWECDAHVTMVQRSPTIVVRSETMSTLAWSHLYSDDAVASGLRTEEADLIGASTPFKLTPDRLRPLNEEIQKRDADLYAGLSAVGFDFDFGEDGTGIGGAYPRRGGGYYIEVGASQMLIEGKIALRSRVGLERIRADGIELSDGSFLPADLIVFATGYGPMNQWAEKLISTDVARKVGRCWGLGSGAKGDPGPWEGELRNMWKPTQQKGLWFHGGNLMQSRFYSRILALQIKARLEGLETPVYGMPVVHHAM
ncbi:MAG: NAD(P)/FAD-dependent oxidoreductase [Gammaproteobacteria bacterium]|nr:NAD(P)/FAD-dependent oxidoreductase [Gammaproteobacteria bacterium]